MDEAWSELEACRPVRRPPRAADVARRALALGAIWLRARIEVQAALEETREPLEAEAARLVLVTWLHRAGVYDFLTFEELPVMEAPVGSLGYEAVVDATWRVEALAPLLWALGWLPEAPPFDQEVEAEDLIEILPLSVDCGVEECDEFVRLAELADRQAIRQHRDLAALWQRRAERPGALDEEERQRLRSIAVERLHALDWLCGRGVSWDDGALGR